MPTLVNPEPHTVRTMEAWAPFRARVHAWPTEKLRARGAELVEEHFPDHAGHREQLRQYLAEAEGEGDLADALILAALRLGEITAFASHPPSLHAYALRRFPWRTFFRPPDALHAIETGAAPRQLAGFVHQSIERELANRPLFIRKLEAAAFLRLRPPSEARLRKAAMALVNEHLHAPLKKREFTDLLLKRCAGCSEHRARLAWAAYAPVAWRRPGRRRRA